MALTFSPDGKLLASADRDSVILWNMTHEPPLGEPLPNTSGSTSLAFSPDSTTLAVGGGFGDLQLWDVLQRTKLGAPLTAHRSDVTSASFSPDGLLLASASRDKTVILWDVSRRIPLGDPFKGHNGSVSSVAFSPDGKTLASGGEQASIFLWDVDPDSWMHKACSIANRNLTHVEWKHYVGADAAYQPPCPNLPGPVDSP
ncbi:WD40 repeat domain-containing protein [Paraburkholderia terrae]